MDGNNYLGSCAGIFLITALETYIDSCPAGVV